MHLRFLCGINGALSGVAMHRHERKAMVDCIMANGLTFALSKRDQALCSRFRDPCAQGVTI
jgi:hypothetical protein